MTLRAEILLYERALGGQAFAVRDTLWLANQVIGRPLFAPLLISVGARPVRCGEVELRPARASARPDILIVPGMEAASSAELIARAALRASEQRHIARVARRGARVGTVCVGAFLAAAAGVLRGRKVTTAWPMAGALARQWPELTVDPSAMVAADGPILTAGAMTAAYDLALALVAEATDAASSHRVRKFMALDAGRTDQRGYATPALASGLLTADPLVDRAQRRLHERLEDGYDLEGLSRACGASSRTLLRRFRAVTGQTPQQYRAALVVEAVKALLETTALRFSEIAHRVGYADEAALRRQFKAATDMTFKAYRRRFGMLPAHRA